MRLDGSTFIVTGGGSGLGHASARRLHGCGAQVLVVDTDVALGQSLAAELGERAAFCRADVACESDARATVRAARDRFGELDGLVNCAGAGAPRAQAEANLDADLELVAEIVRVNIIGTFNMLRLAVAAMRGRSTTGSLRRGIIINTAAAALPAGDAAEAAYAASRGGVVAMTLPLARELADQGIRVVTIVPSRAHVTLETAPGKPELVSGLGRLEEYACLVQEIIENEWLSGASIALDGLSQREVEVLHLVAQGKTNKEIGMILGISARTAQVHISHIYAKIGVGNRAGAVLWLAERQALQQHTAASPAGSGRSDAHSLLGGQYVAV